MKPKQPTTTKQKPLKDAVFARIEREKVCPHSRLFFQSRECFVWFFWFLSVVIGALAIAVSLFVVLHHQYALYEATHDNFFTFMVDVLPYLWIIVFAVMAYVAVYNLRHTKHGYRHPVWMIMASSIVLSFAGGSALQFFGLGYQIDRVLGNHMAMYMSQEKYEQALWQAPYEGRLLGSQTYDTLEPAAVIVFTDRDGLVWRVDVSELHEADRALLADQPTVKLVGKTVSKEKRLFHACGTFPWTLDGQMTAAEMQAAREAFMHRFDTHVQNARKEQQLQAVQQSPIAMASLQPPSPCANTKPDYHQSE